MPDPQEENCERCAVLRAEAERLSALGRKVLAERNELRERVQQLEGDLAASKRGENVIASLLGKPA